MVYLVSGIIVNVLLFLVFRSFTRLRMNNMQAIVVNYYTCMAAGFITMAGEGTVVDEIAFSSWLPPAIFIGVLLIAGFNVAALSIQRAGIMVTSVASKMSMVLPVLFSLLVLKIDVHSYTWLNYVGMALAVLSVYLSSVKKEKLPVFHGHKSAPWLLPFTVFMFGGLLDTTVNYSNYTFVHTDNKGVFLIFIFSCAALLGTLWLLVRRVRIRVRNIPTGIVLGIINYLSLYFVLKGLTAWHNNGAVFYPMLNVGIILIASLASVLIFHEKLGKVNILGMGLAILSLFLLSYQQIIEYFSK